MLESVLRGPGRVCNDIAEKLSEEQCIVDFDEQEPLIYVNTPVEIEGHIFCEKRKGASFDVGFIPTNVKDNVYEHIKLLENDLEVRLCIPYETPFNPETREKMDDILTTGTLEEPKSINIYTYAPNTLEVFSGFNPGVKGQYVGFSAKDFYKDPAVSITQILDAAKEKCEHLSEYYFPGRGLSFEIRTPESYISYNGHELQAFSTRAN